jgi:hypothetical protein
MGLFGFGAKKVAQEVKAFTGSATRFGNSARMRVRRPNTSVRPNSFTAPVASSSGPMNLQALRGMGNRAASPEADIKALNSMYKSQMSAVNGTNTHVAPPTPQAGKTNIVGLRQRLAMSGKTGFSDSTPDNIKRLQNANKKVSSASARTRLEAANERLGPEPGRKNVKSNESGGSNVLAEAESWVPTVIGGTIIGGGIVAYCDSRKHGRDNSELYRY